MKKTKKQQAYKRYYEAHKEEMKERAKAYYYAKKDAATSEEKKKKTEYLKRYYANNKTKWAEYRKQNREAINGEKRRRYHSDPKTNAYYKNMAKLWKKNNPDKALDQDLKLYGIGIDEYRKMLADQGDCCAICGSKKSKKRLCVDHCHKTKAVRGLLCHRCNFAIGLFKDNQSLLIKAAKYIEGFQHDSVK
jgi:hypothetical protein